MDALLPERGSVVLGAPAAPLALTHGPTASTTPC